jgi:MFS family permease
MIFTAFSLLCTIIAHIVEADSLPGNRENTSGNAAKKEFFLWTMIDKNSLPVALIMLPGGIAISGILSFTNAYTSQIGLSEVASAYFIVYSVFLFFSRPAAGRLYDRKGENIVLVPAIAVFALCYCFMAVSKGAALLLVAAGLLAFGYGTMMSVIQTISVRLAPEQHMGMAISTFYICLDVGTGIGGYIIGWLVDGVGFRSMYLIIACLLLAMIPVYWLIHGRTVRRRK